MEVCSPHTQPLNIQPHPWQNHGLSLSDFKGMEKREKGRLFQ